jgi:hypothetical protein
MSSKRLKELGEKLDVRQREAALALVANEMTENTEKRTQEEIAAQFGITYKTLWSWRTQNKTFIAYKNELADDFLADKRAFVYSQLLKSISGPQPSIKGIDLYLRRFGLLTDKTVVENQDGTPQRSEDAIKQQLAELDGLLDEDK